MENKKKTRSIIIAILGVLAVAAVAIALFVLMIKPASQYKRAAALRDNGEYMQAALAFSAMEDYKDAPAQVLLCNYKEAERLETEGRKAVAAMAFGALGDYQDARERSFALWKDIVPLTTFDIHSNYMIGLKEDGSVITFQRVSDEGCELEATRVLSDVAEVAAGRYNVFVLGNNGTVYSCDNNGCEPIEGWENIVDISVSGDLMSGDSIVGLRADGTVIYEASVLREDNDGQGNVDNWRNIVSVKCSEYLTVGLRANGTVIATGLLDDQAQTQIDSWTDVVAIEVGTFHVLGLKSDGTVVFAGDTSEAYSAVDQWEHVIVLSGSSNCTMGLTADGTILHAGDSDHTACLQWSGISAIDDEYAGCYGLKTDGTILLTAEQIWFQPIGTWTDIRQPAFYGFYELDDQIFVDAQAEKGTFTPEEEDPFTNKYGTPTTTCAHANCAAYIANSGDTNCCPWHSNRCGNCRCYIDEDAMYCMDCIKSALD